MGILTIALFQRFSFTIDLFYYFIFVAAVLVIIVIDTYHQIIPDVISLPGIILGFAGSFIVTTITWQQSVLGIFAGGGFLYLLAFGYFLLTKREGMGGGDIKLLAMIGAFLGWQSLLYVIFASSFLGSIVGIAAMVKQKKGGQTRIPYGPFLSVAALSWLIFHQTILNLWQLYLQFNLPPA